MFALQKGLAQTVHCKNGKRVDPDIPPVIDSHNRFESRYPVISDGDHRFSACVYLEFRLYDFET
jgi:hypothetical protein